MTLHSWCGHTVSCHSGLRTGSRATQSRRAKAAMYAPQKPKLWGAPSQKLSPSRHLSIIEKLMALMPALLKSHHHNPLPHRGKRAQPSNTSDL